MNDSNFLPDCLLQLRPDELDAVLPSLSQRYSALYPDWELSFLALPKHDPEQRRRILLRVLEYEEKRSKKG